MPVGGGGVEDGAPETGDDGGVLDSDFTATGHAVGEEGEGDVIWHGDDDSAAAVSGFQLAFFIGFDVDIAFDGAGEGGVEKLVGEGGTDAGDGGVDFAVGIRPEKNANGHADFNHGGLLLRKADAGFELVGADDAAELEA